MEEAEERKDRRKQSWVNEKKHEEEPFREENWKQQDTGKMRKLD